MPEKGVYMLSMDAKRYVDAYQYRNGMLNVGWVAGYTHLPVKTTQPQHANLRLLHVMQTNNLNHALPIHVREKDKLPSRFTKSNVEIKVISRVLGKKLENGRRIAVLEGIDFDTPTVLDMPPEENWHFKVPADAPEAEFKPSKTGLTLSRRSNVVKIAGYVSGIQFTAPGTIKENGNTSNGRLEILISQEANLDSAIPVRIDGKFAESVSKIVKLGMPLLFNDAMFVVNVDKTGEPTGEDGITPVALYPYIEARLPKIATHEDIHGEPPTWARALAEMSRARKAAAPAATPKPAVAKDLDSALDDLMD